MAEEKKADAVEPAPDPEEDDLDDLDGLLPPLVTPPCEGRADLTSHPQQMSLTNSQPRNSMQQNLRQLPRGQDDLRRQRNLAMRPRAEQQLALLPLRMILRASFKPAWPIYSES